MDWTTLESRVPYVQYSPSCDFLSGASVIHDGSQTRISIRQPGKYWYTSTPMGGDFLIEVSSQQAEWREHAFTHRDLFDDLAMKLSLHGDYLRTRWAIALARVIGDGADPDHTGITDADTNQGVEPLTLLRTAQLLGLCEFRRYGNHEPVGGRCLPSRFALGIIFECWSSEEAALHEKRGKHGLTDLRIFRGAREPTFRQLLGINAKFCD